MTQPEKIYTIPFTRILYNPKGFVVDTSAGKFLLTAGTSEFYILANLTREVKRDGRIIIRIAEEKEKPVLLPVAIVGKTGTTWITVTEDEQTQKPELGDWSVLEPFRTDMGGEYEDGFIDPTRTPLSYKELIKCRDKLHKPLDARLHYYMIKSIRKNPHQTDDFLFADRMNFFHGWTDPFPAFLYVKTFGGADTWPSYARMRLMAENSAVYGIPTALKVLKSKKANDRICHYAIILAGLDENNDPLIESFAENCPRALLRVYYTRRSSKFFPMLLENARRLLDGGNDDILDDLPETYMPDHNKYEDFTIEQRGKVTLDMLMLDQLRDLWVYYKQMVEQIDKRSTGEEERLRLGNAVRAFLLAMVYNPTKAVGEILLDVYQHHNHLLYGIWSQDSHYREPDIMWCRYLFDYVSENGWLDNFWQWLQAYAKGYDSYCVYTNQHFFLSIYFRIAYHILPPDVFYDVLARLIDSEYTNVTAAWRGVTDDNYLPEDAPPLDHRWGNMFLNFNYYVWTDQAHYYYGLVAHKIQPHPTQWNVSKWQKDLQKHKKLPVISPR